MISLGYNLNYNLSKSESRGVRFNNAILYRFLHIAQANTAQSAIELIAIRAAHLAHPEGLKTAV